MLLKKCNPEYVRRFKIGLETGIWAVTMTKVRIRQAVAKNPWPHWHLLSFTGREGGESRGVVDLVAIRKDHGEPQRGMKRGDALQIILIQVKGGSAARPTQGDAMRMSIVARRHRACGVLLATWTRGSAAKFYSLKIHRKRMSEWLDVDDLQAVFG